MNALEPPDSFHLSAAIGWLDLGLPSEARVELEKIRGDLQSHPDVMAVKWVLESAEKHWEKCLQIASELVETAPERQFGWIHRSFALHEMKRTQEAWRLLLPAAKKFPNDFLIAYNLSCYAAQMNKLDEAKFWLSKAVQLGGLKEVKKMAVDDLDLKPLWPEIQKM